MSEMSMSEIQRRNGWMGVLIKSDIGYTDAEMAGKFGCNRQVHSPNHPNVGFPFICVLLPPKVWGALKVGNESSFWDFVRNNGKNSSLLRDPFQFWMRPTLVGFTVQ